MATSLSHIENREKLTQFIRSEMMGPCLTGEDRLDCSGEIRIGKWEEAGKPWVQKETGDEIIRHDTPVNRYGIGVLYPPQVTHEEIAPADNEAPDGKTEEAESKEEQKVPEIKSVGRSEFDVSDTDDFDLSLTNTLQPSSMAISFLSELPEGSALQISVEGGRYLQKTVSIEATKRRWFLRQAVSLSDISFESGVLKANALPDPFIKQFENGLTVSVECYSRPDVYSTKQDRENRRLITICLVNRTRKLTTSASEQSEFSLFQAGFSAQIVGGGKILPYPDVGINSPVGNNKLTDEEKEQASFRLLYNTKKTYAIGHGCAASWNDKTVAPPEVIKADVLPEYEIPSVTPDAKRDDDSDLKISMAILAGIESGADELLQDFLAEYRLWIKKKNEEVKKLPSELQEPAARHIKNAEFCVARMTEGLEYLNEDPLAAEAK